MQQYQYTAINLQREKFKGHFIAENERDLAVQLSKQGLFLLSAKPYSNKSPSAFFSLGTGKVTLAELTMFCRQFAIMMNSGLSILGALNILKEQKYSSYFRQFLQRIYEDVKAGVMFSAALDKYEKVFPAFFRNMIKVGESSGKLELVLTSLADYYENDASMRRKTRSAFAYPIFLSVLVIAIVVVMMVYIVPTFRESLSSLDVTPEGITKVVYDTSDFMLENGMSILGGVLSVVCLLFLFSRTKSGKLFFDKAKVRLPLIRTITIDTITARFARGFGLLLTSGMDITEALECVVIVFGNRDVEARFRKAIEEVKHGKSLAESFNQYKIFPPILTQMVAVGEETASLDEVMNRSCSFFDEAVSNSISSIVSKIQPVMLMIMGGVVGVLFIAIYSPMLSIMNSF